MQPDVRQQAWCRRLRERAGVGKSRPRVGGSDLSKYPATSWLSPRHRRLRLLALRAISATAGRRRRGVDGGGGKRCPRFVKAVPGGFAAAVLLPGLFVCVEKILLISLRFPQATPAGAT